MSLKNVNTILTTAYALFVVYLGLSFMLGTEAFTPADGDRHGGSVPPGSPGRPGRRD
ncbi:MULTISPECIES: hypothetical protein [unclassified Streptomyces]|uniref:hypothetical protein n=1 Tax=unclassified Streptomyces TaxID=2593676 RepID=UPI002E2E811D|nr:hypothetical protein [Streptomyces sp. NBC_00441]